MANENIFTRLGASNHAKGEREKNDFYATDNIAAHLLLENEPLKNIWECACGAASSLSWFQVRVIMRTPDRKSVV